MKENDSWKKTEEIEIDLLDLLRRLCAQWKRIAVCAAAFALLSGGFGWLRNQSQSRNQNENQSQNESQNQNKNESRNESKSQNKNQNQAAMDESGAGDLQLTDTEQQAVENAVRLAEEMDSLEKYLEESVLMQADPYCKNRTVLLYSIEDANRREVQKIADGYLTYLTNGGVLKALRQSVGAAEKMEGQYLAELILAWQKTDSTGQLVLDDRYEDIPAGTLLYVEVTGKNERMAAQLADGVQEAMKGRYADVKKTCGGHKLSLLSRETGVRIDSGLWTQQHEKREQLASGRMGLKNSLEAFSRAQKAAYEYAAGAGDEDKENAEAGMQASRSGIRIKYILLGLFGGAFLYCGVYACWYLSCGTLKNAGEFKEYYRFPFYGCVSMKKRGRKSGEDEREKAQVLNRIRLACRKQGVTKLCLAADFSLGGWEKECLCSMAGQLDEWGIDAVTGENAGGNIPFWDTMAETGNVLMICRIGTTTHQSIDEQMQFYLENGITVLGAAALEER